MHLKKSNTKSDKIRLSNCAYVAFELLKDTTFKRRIDELEKINDFSFALLIYWNRVEIALKLRQYYQKIEEEFPTKLDFIDKRTTFINSLYQTNPESYNCVLVGDKSKGVKSIWKIRNKIVHASFQITKKDYDKYIEQIVPFEKNIVSLIPERNEYLKKKRSIKIKSK